MKVFNLFFKIVRAKAGIVALYVVIFFAICFPMVRSNSKKTEIEESSISVCVIDEDQTEASKSLRDAIAARNDLVNLPNDKTKIMDAMFYEMVDYTVIIKKGFEERILGTSDNDSDALFEAYKMRASFQSAVMEQYLTNYVRLVKVFAADGSSLDEASAKARDELSREAKVEIVSFRDGEGPDPDFTGKFAMFFRLLPYIFIAIMVNVLSAILVTLNTKDQKMRLECSSIKMSSYMSQLFLGSGVLTVLIWLVFMVGGMIVYGGIYKGLHCHLAVLNSFIFAFIAALIAILISSFNPTGTVVNMIAQILGLGMAFICGAFVPQTYLGEGVLRFASIFPVYWFEKANDVLSGVQKGTLSDVRNYFLVECGYIVLFVILVVIASVRRGGRRTR